jgi:hypothetical protein
MSALVANRAPSNGGGVVAYVRGHGGPYFATDERAVLLMMRNRLLRHGEHPWETRDRWDDIETFFRPWKPGDE